MSSLKLLKVRAIMARFSCSKWEAIHIKRTGIAPEPKPEPKPTPKPPVKMDVEVKVEDKRKKELKSNKENE